jgi:periplasmic copper chaperone A
MRKLTILSATLILSLLLSGCQTGGAAQARLTITEVWSRPGPPGGNSAVYFNIDNPTNAEDTLLSAQAEVSEFIELHMSSMDHSGTMSMHKQEAVPVPAGAQVVFKPGGLHVMLINLRQGLNAGEDFTLTLNFQNAGQMTLEVPVREP